MTTFLLLLALHAVGMVWLWREARACDDGLEEMFRLPARDPEVRS